MLIPWIDMGQASEMNDMLDKWQGWASLPTYVLGNG
jgi:hypothetical protein